MPKAKKGAKKECKKRTRKRRKKRKIKETYFLKPIFREAKNMQYVSELRVKTAHYLITAFALVTSLSWNSSMQLLINKLFPLNSDEIYAKIIYSLFLTFMLIIIIKYLPGTNSEMPKQVQKDLEEFSLKNSGQDEKKMNQMGYGFPHFNN